MNKRKYISINEPNGFYYHDAGLLNVSTTENNMIWTSDWIAVTPDNSLSKYDNDMRTEDIVITFENYKIEKIKKYGFKEKSSSGKILREISDVELNENEIVEFLNEIKGSKCYCANYYYADGNISDGKIIFEAELILTIYPYDVVLVVVSCDKFIAEWDKYSDKQWN